MIKIISALVVATFCLLPSYSQTTKPKPATYIIKPAIGEKLVTAEAAIKAACVFAKITDITIDKDLIDDVIDDADDEEDYYVGGQSIIDTVNSLAKSKAKDYPSLSNKAIFKYMDLIEM